MSSSNEKAPVVRWLLAVCAMVLLMVTIGGITRLTGSGLSITEWKPIMGAVPPLTEAQWLEAFERYKQIPQYKLLNQGMTLGGFQWIFFWEYLHRLVGRSIGLVLIVPWIVLARRGLVSRALHARVAFGFVLFGLQGLMGWVMVMSGLSERTSVSHFRLAAHLVLALTALGYFLWVIRQELAPGERPLAPAWLRRAVGAMVALLAVQIVYGAFMAGLKAGYMYSTFPTMNGEWVPSGAFERGPLWLELLESPGAVHFMHRTLAWLVVAGALALGVAVARRPGLPAAARRPALALSALALAQFVLGVATVMTRVALPLAVAHQVCGGLLLGCALWTLFTVSRSSRREALPMAAAAVSR